MPCAKWRVHSSGDTINLTLTLQSYGAVGVAVRLPLTITGCVTVEAPACVTSCRVGLRYFTTINGAQCAMTDSARLLLQSYARCSATAPD